MVWRHGGMLRTHGYVLTPNPQEDDLCTLTHSFQVAEATPHTGSQGPLTRTTVVGTGAVALIYSDGEMKAQCTYKSSPFSGKLPNGSSCLY